MCVVSGRQTSKPCLGACLYLPYLSYLPYLQGRWREDARALLAAQPGLNDSQRRAVAAALTRTVTLWQGPPGTGKTRTLLALVEVCAPRSKLD